MKAITVVLRTVQPLLATSLQGDPNSSVSYSYIPGSMLRGALIARYLRRRSRRSGSSGDPTNDMEAKQLLSDSGEREARRLFVEGATRYLNAYPYVRQSRVDERQRFLPAPRSWFLEKGERPTVTDAVPLHDRVRANHSPSLILKGIPPDTYTAGSSTAILTRPRRRVSIHNARERIGGRATSDEGAVFRYDAIDVDQMFQGVILCDTDADADTLHDLLLEGDLWLGGSRSAGYGHMVIGAIAIHSVDDGSDETGSPGLRPDAWIENAPVMGHVDEDGEPAYGLEPGTMVVTLLSDLIARDAGGQHVADLPLRELATQLELSQDAVLRIKNRFASSTLVGGFNRTWGLPLPQVPALAAGSVFELEVSPQPRHNRVRAVVARGLGEGRVDGFGRIAVGWPLGTASTTRRAPDDEPDDADTGQMDDLSRRIASEMAERLLRRRLDALLLDKVGRTRLEPTRLSNSQLSRLAIVARHALTANDGKPSRKPIDDLLKNLPANARRQYQSTRVSTGTQIGKRFDQQLGDWLGGEDKWLDDASIKDVVVAGQQPKLDPGWRLEYDLRLIMAAVKRASKEQQE